MFVKVLQYRNGKDSIWKLKLDMLLCMWHVCRDVQE